MEGQPNTDAHTPGRGFAVRRWLTVVSGSLAAGLLGVLAAWSFLTRPGLPIFTDIEPHVYRVYEVIAALRAGVLYSRWASDLFHGFGYPVFNYYAPLTYYLAAAYGWFFDSGGPVAGMKLVCVVAALAGSLGMFAFARQVWGQAAGVAAAAAFSLAPYLVFYTPHKLGRVPELFALCLTPLLFWSFTRLRQFVSPGRIALAALIQALVLLSHNLVPLIMTALLVGWLAWIGLAAPPAVGRRQFTGAVTAALVIGAAMSLFFWLPAIVEASAVQLDNVTMGFLGYRLNATSLMNLLAPPRLTAVVDIPPHFAIGVAQWLLAIAGALRALRPQPRFERATIVYLTLAALGVTFLITPSSLPVWDGLSFMALLQFPSRLLGPLAFLTAGLAAAAVGWAPTPRWQAAASAAIVLICTVSSLPLLNPLPWADFGPVTIRRIHQAELEWEVGTTASNEFLPMTVASAPGPQPALQTAYAAGLVDKVNRQTLPEGAQVTVTSHGPLHDEFSLVSPEDLVLRLFTFDFPGWTAYVDGVETAIVPSQPEGWITVGVPAGNHAVLVRLEDTGPRRAGWLVSGTGLAAWLGLLVWQGWGRRPGATSQPGRKHSALAGATAASDTTGLLPAAALIGLVIVIGIHRTNWPISAAVFEQQAPQYPLTAQWTNHMALAGYDLPVTSTQPGEALSLTLYWTATANVTTNSSVFVHLFGPDGQLWGSSDKFHPGEFGDWPTGRWPAGFTLTDLHSAVIAPEAPPGEYRVRVGLWNSYTGQRVPLITQGAQGSVLDAFELPITLHVN